MDLQKVDVVGIEALERSIDLIENGLARKATLICIVSKLRELLAVLNSPKTWVFARVTVALCEDDELVAWKLVLLNRFANDLFRDTIGVNISCGDASAGEPAGRSRVQRTSVPSREPSVVCSLQQWQRLRLFSNPWLPLGRAYTHGTQDGHRDFQATFPETSIFGPRLLEKAFDVELVRHGCDDVY
jgi:hypothetical protein